MIDYFHKNYHPWDKPRTYRRIARKEYLALAKSKKRTEKKIRATIRKQLGYVKRDLEYLEDYMEAGYALPSKPVSYTHLRAHETELHLVCRLLLEKIFF